MMYYIEDTTILWHTERGMRIYGIPQCRDKCYGAAAALTYWVFKSRDRATSPAMGTKTWTYLESSIKNSAEVSTCLEEYLQHLSDKLKSHLRPSVLTGIIEPQQRILRVNADGSEIQELSADMGLVFMGWQDLLADIAPEGFTEWDVIEVCRSKASIIQVLCRLRFEEDRATGQDFVDDAIDVEVQNV